MGRQRRVPADRVGAVRPSSIGSEAIGARRTGLSPADMLFIDDREDNVEAARQLGFRAIRVSAPEALAADLAEVGLPVRQPGAPARVPA